MSGNVNRAGHSGINVNISTRLNPDRVPVRSDRDSRAAKSPSAPTGTNPNAFFERQLFDEAGLLKAQFLRQYNTSTTTRAAQQVRPTRAINANSPPEELIKDPRVRAMLDVLGFTEGTGNNYGRVVYGRVIRAPYNPELVGKRNVVIDDFSRHPNILVEVRPGLRSTAAGRYQFLNKTWDNLGMPDFSPRSQDIAAVKLMKQRGMIEPLLRGDLRTAVHRGAPEWASLPTRSGGSFYGGQPAKTIGQIEAKYRSSLARYENGAAPIEPPPGGAPNATLRRGDRGEQVKQLQDTLVRLGHMTRNQVNTGPGIFGQRTENAVKEFQRANNLTPSGAYDQPTRKAVREIIAGVRRGDEGNVVRGLQNRLVELGYMTREQVATGPGIFGRQTQAALRNFQADRDIQQTGVLGPMTYKALVTGDDSNGTGGGMGSSRGDLRLSVKIREGVSRISQQVSSPVLGNFTVTSSFMDPDGHGLKRNPAYAIFSDNPGRIVRIQPGNYNLGIDYVTPDSRIRNWLSGRVEDLRNEPSGYGHRAIIKTDLKFRYNGQDYSVYTHYAHAAGPFNVREGARVRPGQVIGRMGNTGASQGAHVDLRTWIRLEDGRTVDISPNLLVNRRR